MDGYIGEIKMFAGTYAPENWVFCEGQLLSIQNYTSLYAIIGDQFGGDGRTTMGVPDLRGRVPIGVGTGTGLTTRYSGQKGGYERIQLATSQLPAHSHTVKCDTTSGPTQVSNTPQNNLPGNNPNGTSYGPTESASLMKSDMINNAGEGQSHENMPPWQCLHYIMCVNGIWPPRP